MSEISKNIPVSRKKQRRHGNSHLNHLFGRIKRDMHRTARKRGRFKVNRRIEDAITEITDNLKLSDVRKFFPYVGLPIFMMNEVMNKINRLRNKVHILRRRGILNDYIMIIPYIS